jgi:choline dehydrogenase-like flavoprotein
MGGCVIGPDPKTSVVGQDFAVHGLPRLTIADSSIFSAAMGFDPSLTVMAFSHRAGRTPV